MSFAHGNRHSSTTTTAMIARINRLRSSTRCEMNVSCVLSGAGDVIVHRGGQTRTRKRAPAV